MKHISKGLLIAIISAMIGLNIYLGLRIQKHTELSELQLLQLSSELRQHQERASKVEDLLMYQYQSKDTVFDSELSIKLWDGSQEQIAMLASKGPYLVLRFSELQCQTCVELEKENLKKWQEETGVQNILLWGNFGHPNAPKIYKQGHELNHPLYNVPVSSVPLSVEAFNIPYYFVLDKDLRIHSVFIPDKFAQNLSTRYLETIYSSFFQQPK